MIATDKLLMRLSNLDALPGQESQVQEVLMTIIDSNGVKDSFGNLYFGDLTTKKKKIALYAHMDEVGFFVHRITEEALSTSIRLVDGGGMSFWGSKCEQLVVKTALS